MTTSTNTGATGKQHGVSDHIYSSKVVMLDGPSLDVLWQDPSQQDWEIKAFSWSPGDSFLVGAAGTGILVWSSVDGKGQKS